VLSERDERNLRLLEASYQGDEELATELLLEDVDVDTQDGDLQTPLYLATLAGHEMVVKILLESGANSNGLRRDRDSPLMEAAKLGHESIVKMLLERGADVNYGTNWSSPLCEAASEGNCAIVKLLLERGAHIDLPNASYNETALLGAITNRQLAVVDFLLKKGAKVNNVAQGSLRSSPLLRACNCSKPMETVDGAIVRVLLQAGADTEAKDFRGLTPLSYALEYGSRGYFEEGVKLLLEAGARFCLDDCNYLPVELQIQYASQLVKV
jgi:ankyrin repeat protein